MTKQEHAYVDRQTEARRILQTVMAERKITVMEMAARSGKSKGFVSRFLNGHRTLKLESALCFETVLSQEGISEEERWRFLADVVESPGRSGSRPLHQIMNIAAALIDGRYTSAHVPFGLGERSSDSDASPILEAHRRLVTIGIRRDIDLRSAEAVELLEPLVGHDQALLTSQPPESRDVGDQILIAVARAHYGHALINVGRFSPGQRILRRASALFEECQRSHPSEVVQICLAPWNALSGRVDKDYIGWCHQMTGLATHVISGKRGLREARNELELARDAAEASRKTRPQVYANALRDLAAVESEIDPRSPAVGDLLTHSIALLQDLSEYQALAMSCFRRAHWHYMRGDSQSMKGDIQEGLDALDKGEQAHVQMDLVRLSGFNILAEIFADQAKSKARVDPQGAEQANSQALAYAQAVVELARTLGHTPELERAEKTLKRLA